PDLAQGVGRQDRIAPDVVNLVLAHRARRPQDHVGGGASGRRRIRFEGCKEAVVAAGISVRTDNLTRVIDVPCVGGVGGSEGIIEGGVKATAVKEAVCAAGIAVKPDDLSRVVDPLCRGADGAQGIVEGGKGAPAVEKAVPVATGVNVLPDD